jgi:hypothetical protein
MDEKKDDFPVSSTDELSVAGGTAANRPRKLGEFKPTNSPLSAADLNIGETTQPRTEKQTGFLGPPRTSVN